MEEESEDFVITCRKCGGTGIASLEDDGACGDPECCGGRSYIAVITCKGCRTEERFG